MADVAANLKDWSTTASSNSPTDATTIGSGLADNLQEIQKVVRQDLAHKGADIASSAAPDVGAVAGLYHDVTGNNTITGLGSTATAGIWKILQFDGSPVLKNSTALAMVGAGDVTATPGAVGVFFCEATNQWRNVSFFHATAGAVVQSASTAVQGVVELATNAETLTGTDTERAVTPSSLDSVLGMVKLASGQCSATAVCDVTMTAYTAFANKMLVLTSFNPATDAVRLLGRVSTDGGATYDAGAGGYRYAKKQQTSAPASGDIGGTDNAIEIMENVGNGATETCSATITMWNTTSTTNNPSFITNAVAISATPNLVLQNVAADRLNGQDTDAFRVLFSSGNITSGSWVLYGFN